MRCECKRAELLCSAMCDRCQGCYFLQNEYYEKIGLN